MIYLSGSPTTFRHPRLGFINTPDMGNALPAGVVLAADNGCFTNPKGYSDARYMRFLDTFPRDRTLFATAPDVLSDHHATVKRSVPVLRMIRALGLPAAFVAQDGFEWSTTPWDEFDVLFIGGSTAFKFNGGQIATWGARLHNKSVHMGRVNSFRRLAIAKSYGCSSADGTFLKYAPDHNITRIQRWFEKLEQTTCISSLPMS